MREGIEDYEYLYLLRERLRKQRDVLDPAVIREAERLLVVPEDITKSMTEFTTDSAPILAHRAKVAAMIDAFVKTQNRSKKWPWR